MFEIITDSRGFREYVLLKDGQGVLLRTATLADVPALEGMLARVSRDSLRMRFMGSVAQVPRRFLVEMIGNDPRDRACLLAASGEGPEVRVVGFGNYVSLGTRNSAEVAFLVEDEFQGRGVSTLLMERLAGIAAGAGFVGFEADVLFENQAMMSVFRSSGFEGRQAIEGGSYHLEFPVTGAVALRERAEIRERVAAAASVARLLRPRVVAVIGASRRQASLGNQIFQHILRNGFTGTVYPVNNQATSVHGVRAYPSVSVLPEPVDLAVVAVPADQVLAVVEESLAAGAKGLVVVTAGFAEVGPEGAALQKRLVDTVRAHGARLVGPNCLGVLNTDPEVGLDASLASTLPPVGRIGFYSHSAALGLVILDYAAERGLGFSTFVSAGNRADVSGNDLLQYWEEDPATDIAMLYLEAFGNARRFARVARQVSRRKPVLCVKSARSRAGRSAARAHIGARPVSDTEVDSLFAQAGVTRVDTLEELFDVAVLLAHQPLPGGDRVAILGNSGGAITVTADACDGRGLTVVPDRVQNLGSLAGPEDYRQAVQQALEDPAVDAAIVIVLCIGDSNPDPIGRGVRRGVIVAESHTKTPKPVLLCLMGATRLVRYEVQVATSRWAVGFPSYRFPEAAAAALARAAEYARYRQQPAGRLMWFDGADPVRARGRLEAALRAQGKEVTGGWLDGEAFREVLACFGLGVTPNDASRRTRPLRVRVRSHPDFGPLIVVRRAGRPAPERLLPLTDQDSRVMLDAVGLPTEGSEAELLGRVSQLVDEVPWLLELEAEMVPATAEQPARLGGNGRAKFRAPAQGC
jgi:acetate---CoA ligase (ADP-forming)